MNRDSSAQGLWSGSGKENQNGTADYAKERDAHQAIECSESCSCNAATRRMLNGGVKALNQSAGGLELKLELNLQLKTLPAICQLEWPAN